MLRTLGKVLVPVLLLGLTTKSVAALEVHFIRP